MADTLSEKELSFEEEATFESYSNRISGELRLLSINDNDEPGNPPPDGANTVAKDNNKAVQNGT